MRCAGDRGWWVFGTLYRRAVGCPRGAGEGTRAKAIDGVRPVARQGVELVRADLRDPAAVAAACQGVDTVFHAAAVAGIWGPWQHYYQNNTLATEHVIEACRSAGVPRLVFTSSPSVTFDGTAQCGTDETQPYPMRWLAHYPHSKALAEAAVLAANTPTLATCACGPI